jgi:ArsR family transcriptional regulator, arsenate/arsenite/antimonite-responsive transcriptional repressor
MLGSRNVDMSRETCYGGRVITETIVDMSTPLGIAAGPAASECCAPSAGLDASLDAERIAAVAKALAEALRVQVLDVLRRSDRQVCQCELIALFEINQSLLSHHMRKLIDAGLVDVERRHKWAYYTVNADAMKELSAWLS